MGRKESDMKRTSNFTKAFLGAELILLLIFTQSGEALSQTCVPPPPGLVSWWPGDGNAQDIQDNNHGTLQSGTTFAPGMVGPAFSFDGIDDFVKVANSPSVNIGTGDFSIDAWIQTSYSDLQTIMDKRVSTPGVLGYHFFVGLAGLGFQMADGDSYTNYDSGVFINDGNFHHVAATVHRSSPDGGRLYIDGAVVLVFDPTPYSGNLDNAADFRIGGHSGVYPAYSFQGLIDEMDFFEQALTDDEVWAIFNAGSAGKCKFASVEIDIKPGSYPNSINPRSRGKIPVAIITTETFDAATVDSTTVRFGANGTEATPVRSALKDVDKDGDIDMILHFRTRSTGIQCRDTSASLTGETASGLMIQGFDSVKTVGCR
jgi:hypothetical protein